MPRSLALVLLLTSLACQRPDQPTDGGPRAPTAATDPVLDRIRTLGYPDQAIEDAGDHYVVEGDMVFFKEGRAGATADLEQRWYGSWIGSPETIKVCVDAGLPSDGGDDDWRTAIAQAVKEWSDAGGSALKLRVVTSGPCNTLIRSDNGEIGNGNVPADASFPTASGAPGYRIRLNLDAQGNRVWSATEKRAIMLHEIGHTLALEHSNRLVCASPGCGSLVPFTTNTDSASIMISTALPNTTLSSGDRTALHSLYPETVAAASRIPQIIEVFTIGSGGQVRRMTRFAASVSFADHGNPYPAGQGFLGQVTAVSMNSNRLSLFGLGQDGKLKEYYFDGSQFIAKTATINCAGGETFAGQITAISPATNNEAVVRIFGLGTNENVLQLVRRPAQSPDWVCTVHPQSFEAGYRFLGNLAATIWQGVIHVFGVGGIPESPPAQNTSLPSTVLDMWGSDGESWNWSNFAFAAPGLIPDSQMFRGQITAATYVSDFPMVFGMSKDGSLKQLWWNGSGWNFSHLGLGFGAGVRFMGPLSAASRGVNNFEVFGLSGGFGAASAAQLAKGGSVLNYRMVGGAWEWNNLGNSF